MSKPEEQKLKKLIAQTLCYIADRRQEIREMYEGTADISFRDRLIAQDTGICMARDYFMWAVKDVYGEVDLDE